MRLPLSRVRRRRRECPASSLCIGCLVLLCLGILYSTSRLQAARSERRLQEATAQIDALAQQVCQYPQPPYHTVLSVLRRNDI